MVIPPSQVNIPTGFYKWPSGRAPIPNAYIPDDQIAFRAETLNVLPLGILGKNLVYIRETPEASQSWLWHAATGYWYWISTRYLVRRTYWHGTNWQAPINMLPVQSDIDDNWTINQPLGAGRLSKDGDATQISDILIDRQYLKEFGFWNMAFEKTTVRSIFIDYLVCLKIGDKVQQNFPAGHFGGPQAALAAPQVLYVGAVRIGQPKKSVLLVDLKLDIDPHYPQECPRCHGPAYIGMSSVDCKKGCS